jgi:hypothetical protein
MESETEAALIGGLIGGVLTIAGNVILEAWKDSRRAECLAHAIAGEASALVEIIETRGYVESVRECAASAHAGETPVINIRVTKNYFPVMESNLEHIGMLPGELPLLIPQLLTRAKAALEDIEALQAGLWSDRDAAGFAAGYDELAVLLEGTIACARKLVVEVASIYGSPHWRLPLNLRIRTFWPRIALQFRRKDAEKADS